MRDRGTFDGILRISILQKWGVLLFVSMVTWSMIYLFFSNSVEPERPYFVSIMPLISLKILLDYLNGDTMTMAYVMIQKREYKKRKRIVKIMLFGTILLVLWLNALPVNYPYRHQ